MMADRRQSGFTLVEVLVAVAITALLLSAVYGVFTSVSGAKQRLETEGEGYHQARVIFDRIGRELRGTYFLPNQSDTLFSGGTSTDGTPFLELTTTASTPFGGQQGGLAVVRYELQVDEESEDPEARVLIRREESLHDRDQERPGYRLARGLSDLQFRFYADDRWEDEWDARQDGLPQMVEISFLLPVDEVLVPFRSTFDIPIIVAP